MFKTSLQQYHLPGLHEFATYQAVEVEAIGQRLAMRVGSIPDTTTMV